MDSISSFGRSVVWYNIQQYICHCRVLTIKHAVYGGPVTSHTGTLVRSFNLPNLKLAEYKSLREQSRDPIEISPNARGVIQRAENTKWHCQLSLLHDYKSMR
jgi:hypothetical protein